jgi:serine protease AprX
MKGRVHFMSGLLVLSLVSSWLPRAAFAESGVTRHSSHPLPGTWAHGKLPGAFAAEVQSAAGSLASSAARRVVIQPGALAARSAVRHRVALLGGRIERAYESLGLLSAELPLARVSALAADVNVAWVSPEREVRSAGLIETTTGAALVRDLLGRTELDGAGVGVAVLDSGIDARHHAFGKGKLNRVVFEKDFVGGKRSDGDLYGHGTHVASLVAAGADFAGGAYTGVAPGVQLLNLRVLDDEGRGSVSTVLAALDWVVAHKNEHNVRVVNLSLGAPAVESYATDPLCLAARKAHSAGIVVVAAAGNGGKDADGAKLYGGIKSPGIEPSVITVGAATRS